MRLNGNRHYPPETTKLHFAQNSGCARRDLPIPYFEDTIGLPVPATAVIRVDRSLSFRTGSNCLGPNQGSITLPDIRTPKSIPHGLQKAMRLNGNRH